MSRYQAYSEYKDSGVEWLGQLPSHWGAKRLGQFFDERREKVSDEDYPALSVTMQGIVPQLETAAKTDAGDNRKLVLKNDFVINSRSDRKGSSGVSTYDGSVSLISIVMTPRDIHPPFVHHLLRSYPFQEEFYRYGKGIVADLWSTNSSEMRNILIPDVPTSEQAKIAAFLDHETAKIDVLLEKQQRLIELLKEKRQAVISHAVTKGLNPNAPMKDSGVEWLGEVPAHWEVSQLRYVVREGTSITYGIVQAGPEVEEGVPYIRTSDMSGDALPLTGYPKTSPEIDASYARSRVSAGDLVISIRASVGKCLPVPPELDGANLTQGTAKIAPSSKALAVFMLPFIGSSPVQLYLDSKAKGATFKEITLETLRKAPFLVPPVDEQNEIGRWVESTDLRFKALIEAAEQAQLLLKERRIALISAAVTGKIDVRDWQAAA